MIKHSRNPASRLALSALVVIPCAASSKPGSIETKGTPVETKATLAEIAGTPPEMTGFKPDSGYPGDPVLVEGSGLRGVTAVAFGDVPTLNFLAVDDHRMYVLVPPGASSARIRVGDGKAWHASATDFTVRVPNPRLVQISPEHGPPGTRLLLTGTGFGPGMKVQFNDEPASKWVILGPTQALVTAPGGFTRAAVYALGKDGTGDWKPFELTSAPAHLTLELARVTLNQGSQTWDMRLPLVAGRDALLTAVVVADQANEAAPMVRIHLQDAAGKEVFTQDIQAPGKGVPQAHDPAALDRQWTLVLDGKYLQPGCRLRADLIPADTKAGDATPLATWPGDGHGAELKVVTVPPLQITLVPVELDGRTGNVDDPPRKLADWAEAFQAMFPVGRVEVVKGKTLHCTGSVRADDLSTWENLAKQVEAQRLADGKGATQFYFGVVKAPYSFGTNGYGLGSFPQYNQNRSAVGADTEGQRPDLMGFRLVFAHEMGHTLGCGHAPISLPDLPIPDPDPAFRHPRGDIGCMGWDRTTRTLKTPGSFKDIMGYCPPYWISDYTYEKALYFLLELGQVQETKAGH